jgi:hypothetical protein
MIFQIAGARIPYADIAAANAAIPISELAPLVGKF